MITVEFPKNNVQYFAINNVYISADDVSVNQYCIEHGVQLHSYEGEVKQRFSNDGALPYQYYDTNTSKWITEFGYNRIVEVLIYQ